MKRQLLKNIELTILSLTAATVLSFLFFHFGHQNSHNIPLIYILALILIALNTEGYVYGIFASLFCVAAINVFFTFPYYKMDFSLDGYPFTFVGMLTISIITSTATTRIKKQKLALEERERKLIQADKERLRANLLRAISHDLRTPLTSIIGSSSSYMEGAESLSPSEKLELISNINEDAHWLLNMVENLLSVTRIQDSGGEVRKTLEVVEEVVGEAITRVRKRHRNLSVNVDMPPHFLMVPMDAILIEQVLINLLENAFLHADSKQPIELIIQNQQEQVTFRIKDYGVGLDENRLETLFEGKYQSESTDSHRGFGIGLPICRTIITAHGGTIRALNHENGAEFIFSLPKEKVTEDEA